MLTVEAVVQFLITAISNYWTLSTMVLQLLITAMYVPLWKGKFIAGHKNATYGSIEAGQFTPFGTLFIKIGISSK